MYAHPSNHRINDDRRRYVVLISSLSHPVDSSKDDCADIRTFDARSTMLEDQSRSSSPTSEASSESPLESIITDGDCEIELEPKLKPEIDFEIEEIHPTEHPQDEDLATLKPTQYEDPESDLEYKQPARWSMRQQEMEEETGIINGLQGLSTRQDGTSEVERERSYQRTRNRYSAGKRTYSQSIDSGSDEPEDCDMSPQDLDSPARRLRRRVKRASNRNSFVSNEQSVEHVLAEVEEPDDGCPRSSISFSFHGEKVEERSFVYDLENADAMDIDQAGQVNGNFI
jgi:hypothetical protein